MKNKTLFLSSEFPPLPGGIGNHAYHLAKGLQENRMQVTVVTDQRSAVLDDDLSFDKKLSFPVIRIKRYSFVAVTYVLRILCVLKYLVSQKPTVVIASGKFSLWLAAFSRLFFSRQHYVAILHGSEIFAGGNLSRRITRWSLSKFESLIAVSFFTKKLALQQNDSLDITVINNGFSLSSTDKMQKKVAIKGNPAIVSVGNVTFRKGQQNVINALLLLKSKFPDIHYHIVGIPTEQNKFSKLAHDLGVADLITFHGALPDSDLIDVVSQSDVFFMLSDHLKNGDVEGFGIAVLEANCIGLPAIGSRNSGIADAIKDGYSGRLVSPHDVEEIADALEDVMAHYDRYSKQAFEWSHQFKWSVVIKKYLGILNL